MNAVPFAGNGKQPRRLSRRYGGLGLQRGRPGLCAQGFVQTGFRSRDAFTTAGAHTVRVLELAQRTYAVSSRAADLVFGDGFTQADVHGD